jgi:hypothetical protein
VPVKGPLDILFYEGWRVGVRPGEFKTPTGEVISFDYSEFNEPIDFLMYLDAEPEDVWEWKLRSSQQDHERAKPDVLWSDNDTEVLRKKWDEWMAPFLRHHEATLALIPKDRGGANFVITKSNTHHIMKTEKNTRQRLRDIAARHRCRRLGELTGEIDIDADEFVRAAEELMLSPGNVKTHIDRRTYTVCASVPLGPMHGRSEFKSAAVDATGLDAGEALARLKQRLGRTPDFVLAYAAAAGQVEELAAGLAVDGRASLGCTSGASGVLVGSTYAADGACLFGISDPGGAYVVAHAAPKADHAGNWRCAASEAALDAQRQAESQGLATPSVIILHCTLGQEEAAVMGVQDIFPETRIFGGSAADADFQAHNWRLLCGGQVHHAGVSLALLFPTVAVELALNSMHTQARGRGVVTRAKNRRIYTIDDKPAGEVYRNWCSNQADLSSRVPTSNTTLNPLARSITGEDGVEKLFLMHPAEVNPHDGSLGMFCEVHDGEVVHLAAATQGDLVGASAKSVQELQASVIKRSSVVAGAVMIYCAGAAMELQRAEVALGSLASEVADVLPATAPFVGMFPFGEQGPKGEKGPSPCGVNCHANLMCNVLLFHGEPEA